ncbi:MAG: DNA topoisomerase IV subunit B, partial [Pseudomonadota bacterium]
MTYFVREMPKLIADGHLYLAQPPLYRLTAGAESLYARDDPARQEILEGPFKNKKVETSRFKGLGEMDPKQLRETTMDPKTRTLQQVHVDPESGEVDLRLVDELMGRRPELRLAFIQANASLIDELDI